MMQHEDLTRQIIGCAYEAYNHLGGGFAESVYEKSLAFEFIAAGLDARFQARVPVYYKGNAVGDFVADVIIADAVIVELKAIESLARVHQVQLVHYLVATGIDVGLLINFGPEGVEIRRKLRTLPPRIHSPDPVDPNNPVIPSEPDHPRPFL